MFLATMFNNCAFEQHTHAYMCVLCTCIRSHGVAIQTLPAVDSVVVHLVVHFIPVTSILHHLSHETAATIIKLETLDTFLKFKCSSAPSFCTCAGHTVSLCSLVRQLRCRCSRTVTN